LRCNPAIPKGCYISVRAKGLLWCCFGMRKGAKQTPLSQHRRRFDGLRKGLALVTVAKNGFGR